MKISDTDLVKLWTLRCGQWQRVLVALRRHHESNLGRKPGTIHWMGSPELGPWSWFGFFWEPEKCWFGYGLRNDNWRPLIEADMRQAHARAWRHLGEQLPTVWNYEKTPAYLRLWAPAELGTGLRAHERWFRERTQELHEYALA